LPCGDSPSIKMLLFVKLFFVFFVFFVV